MSTDPSLQPRLSMVTLGLLAGVAGLWVYSAMRQQRQQQQQDDSITPPTGRRRTRRRPSTNGELLSLGSEAAAAAAVARRNTTLRRTGTIRRARRQTTGSLNGTSSTAQFTIDPPLPTTAANPTGDNAEPAGAVVVAAISSRASQAGQQHLDTDSESDSGSEVDAGGADKEMRLLALLCAISEDHSRRASVVHRGMTCNNCNDVPIRGARYKCAQCADFDLCEACEAHDVHRHHVLLKIAVPVPSLMNPRTPLVRRFYPGELEPRELSRTVSEQLEATTHLHSVDLASLYCEFCVLASIAENGTEVVTRDTFFKCLGQFGSSRSVLAARLFAFFDADGDGVLTFPELARSFSVYNKGTLAEKTPHVFRAYDVDGDGKISRDDLRIMLEAFADTNRDLTHNMVHTMEDDILEDPAKLLPGQPVSAAFTAPIPADSPSALDKEVTALRAEVMAMRESSAARRVAMLPVRTREPSESGHTAEMRNTSRSSSRASARIDAGREPDDHNGSSSSSVSFAATTSATIGTVASLNTPRPLVHPTTQTIVPSPASTNAAQQPAQSESSVSHTRSQVREPSQGIMARSTASLNASMDALDEEYDMPVMEALSQDAIRLMIDDIFAEATPADPTCLEYDEFCSYLQRNAGLAIYLEVLGSIF